MPTQIAAVQGIHPLFAGSDEPIGVDATGTRWAISFQGRNAVMVATFASGASLEFKIPTGNTGNTKAGNVAAFTIPNFGEGRWVTHREHVKFEVRFPTPPKVTTVSVNVARLGVDLVSDGQGGLDVLAAGVKVGALPRPWIEYMPDGGESRRRVDLDWVVAEPSMTLAMPSLSATEWATAVLDPTVITTSTTGTATAYSNQRKIDRTSNGVLWAMFWDGTSNTTDSMHFRYSTDDGATWNDGGGFGFAGTGTGYAPNGSFFIARSSTGDDLPVAAYKDRHNGYVRFRAGVFNAGRTAITWGAPTTHFTEWDYLNYPDVVAYQDGAGWVAHLVASRDAVAFQVTYSRFTVDSGGSVAQDSLTYVTPDNAATASKYPSIDFNHTGDGKTVAGGTPHLYVAWSAGAAGAGKGVRFRKSTYSGGSWTWGTEREIDSTSFANAGCISSYFDGTRVVIAYADAGSTSTIKIRERDAADTTATTRTPTALSDGVISGLSVTYDDDKNIHLVAAGATSADPKTLKYDRLVGTWAAWETVEATTTQGGTITAKRGESSNKVEFLYTKGAASPYSVTYGSVVTAVPPSEGVASGSVTLTGSAAGSRASKGSATGALDLTGSASGKRTPKGAATGSVSLTGSATGKRVAAGSATGAVLITGTASGFSQADNVAAGSVVFTGTATGARVSKGSATGTVLITGTAAGEGKPTGTATGALLLTGSATGETDYLMFSPPVRYKGITTNESPFRFYQQPISMNVIYRNGHFQEVRVAEDTGLEEGVTWFSGGRTYEVDKDTRILLEADGFTVDVV